MIPVAPRLVGEFFEWQRGLSRRFDRLLPPSLQVSGKHDFRSDLVPRYIRPGLIVYDVGGGKSPVLSLATKEELKLTYRGVDNDARELAQAPEGTYDSVTIADIAKYEGPAEADVVICEALLEHVPDVGAAIRGVARMLNSGGVALVFVPCRNAPFAVFNRLLPESWKRLLLDLAVRPSGRSLVGFPAYYDRCTPRHFRELGLVAGLEVVEERAYFKSGYSRVFLPVHILYRLWVMAARALRGAQASESFSVVFRKPDRDDASTLRG